MLKPSDMISITNRSSGSVVYRIPENHIRREFNVRERKLVPCSEIIAVAAQAGGRELLYNYFYFDNKDILKEILNIKPEPEYELTEKQIPTWIVECSLAEFQDALDFAPNGIKELIKRFAVELPLYDMQKIKALKDQLGFNCEQAIKNEEAIKEDMPKQEATGKRRVEVKQEEEVKEEPTRRTSGSKYKVVSTEEK